MALRPIALTTEYELVIYGDIGDSWWGESVTALSVVQQLGALDASVTQINLRVNSYGGSVSDGLAIYNALRRHSARKVGTVDGVAMSSASLVMMACDEILMPATSLLMIHAPWGLAQGNAADMRVMADVLDTFADAMASAYATKTGKPKPDMLALLSDGQDHYYTGEQALAEGFADAIVGEATDDTSDAAAAAAASVRAAGVTRFLGNAPEHIQQLAQVAARRHPTALPAASAKPRVRVDATGAMPLESALGTPEGQQAFQAALIQAATADSGDSDMLKRRLLLAMGFLAPHADPVGAPSTPATPPDPVAALAARNESIRATFRPFLARDGVNDLLIEALADPTVTVEAANARVLAHLGAQATPVGNVRIENGPDEADKFRAAAQNAILARKGMAKADGQNPLRGQSMREIARASLQRNGRNTDGMDVREIMGAAFTTTSDFPFLLTSTARAAMLRGYEEAPETFSQFTRAGTLTDFREATSAGLGFFSDLDRIPESGEYKHGTFGANDQKIVLATYGKLFAITRQALINDDLGAFTDVPRKMGRAAKRTIGNLVFDVLIKNRTMADGKALFHADHGNLVANGGPITTEAITALRVRMATQKVGKQTVSIPLKYLVVPVGLEAQALTVLNSEFKIGGSDGPNTPNAERGRFEVISDARLDASADGNAWFGLADPSLYDTIEVAYLDGMQEPFLDQKEGWNVDGTQFKVRIDAGVAPLDYRGMAKNDGGP